MDAKQEIVKIQPEELLTEEELKNVVGGCGGHGGGGNGGGNGNGHGHGGNGHGGGGWVGGNSFYFGGG
jgi:bacteriocin-like protein